MRKQFLAFAAGIASVMLSVQILPLAGFAADAPRQASANVSKDIGLVGNVYTVNGTDQADQDQRCHPAAQCQFAFGHAQKEDIFGFRRQLPGGP